MPGYKTGIATTLYKDIIKLAEETRKFPKVINEHLTHSAILQQKFFFNF